MAPATEVAGSAGSCHAQTAAESTSRNPPVGAAASSSAPSAPSRSDEALQDDALVLETGQQGTHNGTTVLIEQLKRSTSPTGDIIEDADRMTAGVSATVGYTAWIRMPVNILYTFQGGYGGMGRQASQKHQGWQGASRQAPSAKLLSPTKENPAKATVHRF